ncbi:endonuclease V [Candidatus Woesearchaeota archaeon]|nr:endonuclease V [Candidatus Woesearchaeota archaeon]HIH25848.1 hypothetical protein [Nanoarchaeota archaeon]
MKTFDMREFMDIEKKVIKAISLKDSINEVKTVASFEIASLNKKYKCCAVVIDYNSLSELEVNFTEGDELMSYSPRTIPFREGPIIIEAYRSLKIKPDVLIIRGDGALRRSKVGLASYVGVLINKPSIGVTKELIHGALNEDNIIIDDEIKGKALKIKELANPVYISPGHGLSVDKALEIIKKVSDPEYKLPLPMHLAHKHINKLKK